MSPGEVKPDNTKDALIICGLIALGISVWGVLIKGWFDVAVSVLRLQFKEKWREPLMCLFTLLVVLVLVSAMVLVWWLVRR